MGGGDQSLRRGEAVVNVLERVRDVRGRAPKVFDLACAIVLGFVIAAIWMSGR